VPVCAPRIRLASSHELCRYRLPTLSPKVCNFEQSHHMVGNVTCALFYQGGHGLLSVDSIDVRTLTTAFFGFLDIGGKAPESLGLGESGSSPGPFCIGRNSGGRGRIGVRMRREIGLHRAAD
jgi:hypothetical protein